MDYDPYEYEDLVEEEWLEERPRDSKIDEAREVLREFFNQRSEEVFYVKQLEVFFEKQLFHWITGKAINELVNEGILGAENFPLGKGTRIKFVFNKR